MYEIKSSTKQPQLTKVLIRKDVRRFNLSYFCRYSEGSDSVAFIGTENGIRVCFHPPSLSLSLLFLTQRLSLTLNISNCILQ